MANDHSAVEFLTSAGAGAIQHHGGTLLDHLVGTSRRLRSWGCPPPVCSAGLFHSFYSWLAEPTERSRVALSAAIGMDAEELVFLFGNIAPDDLVEPEASAHRGRVLLKWRAARVSVELVTYANLLRLDLANTEDILTRAPLTPEQRQRMLARCVRVREHLAWPAAVTARLA
jgi:hypothetical protein